MMFPVSASTLNYVSCGRAINCKRNRVPAEVFSDDELLVFGVDIHNIFNELNRHVGHVDDNLIDEILAKHFQNIEDIADLRKMAIRYVEQFPINQVAQSEINLAVDANGDPVPYESPEAMIRGRIDVVLRDEAGNTILIDHKSGYAVFNPDTFQNRMYAYLWKKNFPQTEKLIVGIHFSRKNQIKLAPPITDWAFIEHDVMVAVHKAWNTPEDAPPAPGKPCDYCQWVMSCPAGAVREGKAVITSPEDATSIAQQVHVMDVKMKELKKLLRAYVARYGSVDIDETKCYGFKENRKFSADLDLVLSKLPEYPSLRSVLSVDAKRLVDHPAEIPVEITAGASVLGVRNKESTDEEEDV